VENWAFLLFIGRRTRAGLSLAVVFTSSHPRSSCYMNRILISWHHEANPRIPSISWLFNELRHHRWSSSIYLPYSRLRLVQKYNILTTGQNREHRTSFVLTSWRFQYLLWVSGKTIAFWDIITISSTYHTFWLKSARRLGKVSSKSNDDYTSFMWRPKQIPNKPTGVESHWP